MILTIENAERPGAKNSSAQDVRAVEAALKSPCWKRTSMIW